MYDIKEIKFVDIDGIKLGHSSNFTAGTGCTVVLCEDGASGGVDVRGGAPGTRETDLLNPMEMVEKIHAVVLSGGSAFGLECSSGVMEYLEKKGVGFDVSVTKVPIVCQAVLFDLVIGDGNIRPDKAMGIEACINSENYLDDINGCIGAGTGACVGKILGPNYAMKSGLGSYSIQVGDLQVGAIVAVNCLGDVIDPSTNKMIAGVLNEDKKSFKSTEDIMLSIYNEKMNAFKGNTTIGIIVTNANLNKAQANKIASMAHNGYGRTLRPAHTMFDGDTIFTMATCKTDADVNVVGFLAANVMEKAIIRAIKESSSMFGLKCYNDIIF